MVVKDNHPLLRKKIERFFECPALFEPTLHTARTCGKGHGRTEERSLVASGDVPAGYLDFPRGYLDFPRVGQVFRLTRTITRGSQGQQKEHTETVYGLTSLSPAQASPARLLSLARGHWHIENKSHFVRDTTFDEDRSQARGGSIPQVMAAIRNACIGLTRAGGHKNIAAACRFHAAQPQAALALLGIQKTE